MARVDVELVVFTIENDRLKVFFQPDPDRLGYLRLPWREWGGDEDFVGCVNKLANQIVPSRRRNPHFFSYFSMPHPRRALMMTFFTCTERSKLEDALSAGSLVDLAMPERLSHVYLTVLASALKQLRSKEPEQMLAAEMLDEPFTLSQLQAATESIRGGELDKRHFRREILEKGLLLETGEMTSGGAHRPAKLYRIKATRPGKRMVA